MKLSQFNFYLPKDLIAKEPLSDRENDKLMVVHRDTGEIEHKIVKNLPEYFDEGDLMIFNNVKIIPAILYGQKDKNHSLIQVYLVRELKKDEFLWEVNVSPARKIRIGNKIHFENGLVGEIKDNTESSGRTIKFNFDGTYEELKKMLYSIGKIPLPPFIDRESKEEDRQYFNHPFAKIEAAVVSPFSPLHFTELLLKRLELRGVEFTEITLFPGVFNFEDIQVEDLNKHKVGAERMIITEEAANKINQAIDNHKKVCAVGTSVVKALESSATTTFHIDPYDGWISKFIFPPYEIKTINALFVSFYLPKSPMLMTVAAFGGYELIMKAYKEAVDNKYRFGPFGDAMLII